MQRGYTSCPIFGLLLRSKVIDRARCDPTDKKFDYLLQHEPSQLTIATGLEPRDPTE